MSGGVGRGRGWLNLKGQNIKSPGSESNIPNHNVSPDFNLSENKKFSDAGSDYSDLISKINQLNINDDGIKFNQKIQYIIENWAKDCQSAPEVEKSFEAIHQACLGDGDLATKLVLLISSRTFLSQEIHEQNIRLMFLRKLQDNFESCVQLRSSNPNYFRNSILMMGEFFNKARLANGQQFSFMSIPIISYLEMLLESSHSVDLKLFTMQLYLNGSALKQECPERITEILGKVRHQVCFDKQQLSPECKFWLLLAVEVASNRFALLPADVHSFYQEQLGIQAMASFQGTHTTLTVQTAHNNKNFDNFQSHINVLQVSNSLESAEPTSPENNSTSDYSSGANFDSSGFHSDTSKNVTSMKKDISKDGKTGRPILGAGARLYKNRLQNESSNNWDSEKSQDDTNSRNWNRSKNSDNKGQSGTSNWQKNKSEGNTESNWREKGDKKNTDQGHQKKDWEKKKTPPKNSKKGWEHDDRFETDYN